MRPSLPSPTTQAALRGPRPSRRLESARRGLENIAPDARRRALRPVRTKRPPSDTIRPHMPGKRYVSLKPDIVPDIMPDKPDIVLRTGLTTADATVAPRRREFPGLAAKMVLRTAVLSWESRTLERLD